MGSPEEMETGLILDSDQLRRATTGFRVILTFFMIASFACGWYAHKSQPRSPIVDGVQTWYETRNGIYEPSMRHNVWPAGGIGPEYEPWNAMHTVGMKCDLCEGRAAYPRDRSDFIVGKGEAKP
jgi:hypothetical protein